MLRPCRSTDGSPPPVVPSDQLCRSTLRLEAPGLDGIEAQAREQLGGLRGCAVEIHRHQGPVTPDIFGIGKSHIPTVTGFTLP